MRGDGRGPGPCWHRHHPGKPQQKEFVFFPGNQRTSQQPPRHDPCVPGTEPGTASCGSSCTGESKPVQVAGLRAHPSLLGPQQNNVKGSISQKKKEKESVSLTFWGLVEAGGGGRSRTGRRNWKEKTRGPLFPHSPGTPTGRQLPQAVLCSTQQLGGKWEVGTKLQISFQIPSQPCEWA